MNINNEVVHFTAKNTPVTDEVKGGWQKMARYLNWCLQKDVEKNEKTFELYAKGNHLFDDVIYIITAKTEDKRELDIFQYAKNEDDAVRQFLENFTGWALWGIKVATLEECRRAENNKNLAK